MAVFVLIASFATWLSSRRYIAELQASNQITRLMSLATRSAQNIYLGRENLEKVEANSSNTGLVHFAAFEKDWEEAKRNVANGLKLTAENAKLQPYFLHAMASLAQIEQSSGRVRSLLPASTLRKRNELREELHKMKKLELEAIESLRKVRFEMGNISDVALEEVYQHRNIPFLVFSLVSLLFFFAALALGMSVTKRLKSSIHRLLSVTDEVAKGNLATAIPIHAHDEIGRLTFAFVRMLENLKESMDRLSRLQKITAEFSRALEPKEVAEAVVAEGILMLGASAGAVLTLSGSDRSFEFFRATGYPENTRGGWSNVTLDGDMPVSVALRNFQPYFAESRKEIFKNFPVDKLPENYAIGSAIVIPLGRTNEIVGALTFRFESERAFSDYERNFAITLGALASQAYKRASLYEEAQKAIDIRESFLSIAAHELKTPLTSLKLQLQLGEIQVAKSAEFPLSPPKINRLLQVCQAQANRLNTLVDDLLDVGRIERGTIVYTMLNFNLKQLVDVVLERFGEALRLKDCTVELESPEPILARGDSFRIEQVLINLLSNAVKYGQEKPIRVRLGKQSGMVYFSVSDQGIGISPEKQSLVFDRFERAISSRNISGLGLGLFISRRIVEMHGGTIGVQSELGEGATFTVELPAGS